MLTHWSYVFLALTHRNDDDNTRDPYDYNNMVMVECDFIEYFQTQRSHKRKSLTFGIQSGLKTKIKLC